MSPPAPKKTSAAGGSFRLFLRDSLFSPAGLEHTTFIYALIRVGAKVIALSLDLVGRQVNGVQAVVIGQRYHQSRCRRAQAGSSLHHETQVAGAFRHDTTQSFVKQEVGQLG
jgi:CubicO group peptidase (beta-lactamase class C family)